MRGLHASLPPRQGGEVCSEGYCISSNYFSVYPSLSWANTSAPLTPRHRAALDLGWLWQGKRLDHGTQKWPGPETEPEWDSGHGRCLFKQCLRSSPDLWRRPHNHSSPPEACWEPTWALPTLQSSSTMGQGQQRLGSAISCVGQRGPASKDTSERRHQCLHTEPLSMADTSREPAGAPLTAALPSPGQRSRCWERGKHTVQGNRACLGFRPHPDRVVIVTEQRGSPTSHLAPALAPPPPTPPPTKVIALAHPEERCDLHPHQIQLSHQRHWAHTVCTGTLPHRTHIQDHSK